MDQNSVVDYIKKTGGDASPQGRASLYEKNGLGSAKDYLEAHASGTNADMNTRFLNKLRGGPAIVSTVDVHREAKDNNDALNSALIKLGGNPTNPTMTTEAGNETPTMKKAKKKNPDMEEQTTVQDPFIQGLNDMGSRSDLATQRLIRSTQAMYQNKVNTINKEYDNYTRGLQALGIQHNDATATPDLLAGHIKEAANEKMSKISELDAEEAKTIMDAQAARDDNDFRILKEKMDYLKEIQKEKANAIKDMYDNIANSDKLADIQAHDIYDTLQTLDPNDQEAFIQEVARRFNIPLISLVTALADEKTSRADADLDKKNKESLLRNREDGGGGGTKITIDTASNEIGDHLKPISEGGILGDDGYMDPNKWVELRDDWIKGKLSKSTFDTLYKRYLNPESYEVAGFKAPTGDIGSKIESAFH